MLNADKEYQDLLGGHCRVNGRSLLFWRNVGHLMTNPAIIDRDGFETQESIMDAMISSVIALHALQKIIYTVTLETLISPLLSRKYRV